MSEIMIDGVDVSECQYFGEDKKEIGNYRSNCQNGRICKHQKNCYYKRLKRLEQENKALKRSLKDLNIVAVVEESEKLKKTIEKIKALNLFSLNNSREKIAEINAIINDQKESELKK